MDAKRRNDLAKIHLAKKGLGLDDDTYRMVLRKVAGVDSAKELDERGRAKVIAHFKARGFKPKRAKRPTPADDRAPLVRKVRALLANDKRPDAYADGIAKHMFGVTRFEWCTPKQLRKIIAALNYDKRRKHGGKKTA